jgi:hypothetical protein
MDGASALITFLFELDDSLNKVKKNKKVVKDNNDGDVTI